MTTVTSIGRLVDGLLSVVWGPVCAACGTVLDRPSRGIVCDACWARVRRCPAWPPPPGRASLTSSRSAGWYEGSLRSIIHAFKYQGRRSLATPLAALMREAGRDLLDSADLVVPVPLHSLRRWARGFNQARDLALELGPPVADVLKRTRRTPPQTTLIGSRRHANVQDVFTLCTGPAIRSGPTVAGLRVVVVDDVMTTGATVNACGRVLRAGGAREVYALTTARVSAPRPRRLPRPPRAPAADHRRATTRTPPPDGDSFRGPDLASQDPLRICPDRTPFV